MGDGPHGHVCAALPATPALAPLPRPAAACRPRGSARVRTTHHGTSLAARPRTGRASVGGRRRPPIGRRPWCVGDAARGGRRGRQGPGVCVVRGRQARGCAGPPRHAGWWGTAPGRGDSRGGRFALALRGGARARRPGRATIGRSPLSSRTAATPHTRGCAFFYCCFPGGDRFSPLAVRVRHRGIRGIRCAAAGPGASAATNSRSGAAGPDTVIPDTPPLIRLRTAAQPRPISIATLYPLFLLPNKKNPLTTREISEIIVMDSFFLLPNKKNPLFVSKQWIHGVIANSLPH